MSEIKELIEQCRTRQHRMIFVCDGSQSIECDAYLIEGERVNVVNLEIYISLRTKKRMLNCYVIAVVLYGSAEVPSFLA